MNILPYYTKIGNTFDFKIFPFPNEVEMQCLLHLVLVDIALCIPF